MPSLYDMCIPVYIRALGNMSEFLKAGERHCDDNNILKEKLLQASLTDDMKPLTFQIQTASNTAKWVAVRIGGIENENMEDNEKTFPELYERIEKTIAFLKKTKPEDFEGKDELEVGLYSYKFTGLSYLQKYAVPNFFFHETAAYAILRKEGVPVGKFDFLGRSDLS